MRCPMRWHQLLECVPAALHKQVVRGAFQPEVNNGQNSSQRALSGWACTGSWHSAQCHVAAVQRVAMHQFNHATGNARA